jgi:C-terminal processing protease CtpA/Prc
MSRHSSLIGCKVTHINDLEISEVIGQLRTVIAYENESFLKSQLPKYIRVAEVLYGLEIIDDLKELSIGVEYGDGIASKIQIKTYTEEEISLDYISIDNLLESIPPLYRRRSNENYWSQHLADNNILYINYNCCKNMKETGAIEFFSKVLEDIERLRIGKIVMDLRNNFGGNSKLIEPFILGLKDWMGHNDAHRLFTIIGRDTFSSALLNAYSLKNDAGAILLGEASGGKPNCYGEVLYIELSNSKLRIRYSTKYYDIIEDDSQESLFPDIKFEVKFKDLIGCKDPVMEYILNGEVN